MSYRGSFSWLGPNLTSHSIPGKLTPDEQAYYQLSLKENFGLIKPCTKDTKHQTEYIQMRDENTCIHNYTCIVNSGLRMRALKRGVGDRFSEYGRPGSKIIDWGRPLRSLVPRP